ncbi:MAG: flagellar assembly protein FliW [Pirellulaceae bacterium]|jgi:flagellar assembly factor FliW|nr:flagellar assembly protein FliW [Pirellulaceae bacterium]
MKIQTTRFDEIEIEPDDILFFRQGVFGFEQCRHWVLLADADNPAVAWLQSIQKPETALPVVSPRKFVKDYRVRMDQTDIDALMLDGTEHAYVLAVVGRESESLTLNLRAPIIVNLDRRLGAQVVTTDNQPLQFSLSKTAVRQRRSA